MDNWDLKQEHIRALRCLSEGKTLIASGPTINELLEDRLAWIGPPPESSVEISYRGRNALRVMRAHRASLSISLRACRRLRRGNSPAD